MGTIVNYILIALYIIVCTVLVVIILSQQGKEQGLGALTGAVTETYWAKIKGRSKEGVLKKVTCILSVLFFGLSLLIDMNLFK